MILQQTTLDFLSAAYSGKLSPGETATPDVALFKKSGDFEFWSTIWEDLGLGSQEELEKEATVKAWGKDETQAIIFTPNIDKNEDGAVCLKWGTKLFPLETIKATNSTVSFSIEPINNKDGVAVGAILAIDGMVGKDIKEYGKYRLQFAKDEDKKTVVPNVAHLRMWMNNGMYEELASTLAGGQTFAPSISLNALNNVEEHGEDSIQVYTMTGYREMKSTNGKPWFTFTVLEIEDVEIKGNSTLNTYLANHPVITEDAPAKLEILPPTPYSFTDKKTGEEKSGFTNKSILTLLDGTVYKPVGKAIDLAPFGDQKYVEYTMVEYRVISYGDKGKRYEYRLAEVPGWYIANSGAKTTLMGEPVITPEKPATLRVFKESNYKLTDGSTGTTARTQLVVPFDSDMGDMLSLLGLEVTASTFKESGDGITL